MSIIRSNIARQLLAEGGAPRKGYVTGGDIEDDVAQMETSMGISGGPSPSEYSGLDQESQAEADADRFRAGFRTPDYISMGVSDDATDRGFFQRGIDALGSGLQRGRGNLMFNYLGRSIAPTMRGRLGLGKPGDINYVLNLLQNPDDRVYGLSNKERQIGEKLIDAGIKDEFDIRNMTQAQFDSLFPGPTKSEGGDSEPIRRLRAPITEDKKEEPKDEFADILKFYGARFEDGGEVRQGYGLGSIVKKATRAVKKVAKSPLGKAAILGGLTFGIPGTSFKGLSGLDAFKNLSTLQKAFLLGGTALSLSPFATEEEEEKLPTVANTDPEMTKFIDFYGGPTRFVAEGGDIDEAPIKMASAPSTFGELNQLSIDLFGRPYDQLNDSEQEILIEYFTKGKKQGIERATAARGGMMNPNDEMLDLGGNEMDLRGGGFVPLGEYEKKDDVPARLSKNEFVFTADAVRAAGGGSVDRGADIMYKTMKNLENKVA